MDTKNLSFSKALFRLEEIISKLESNNLDLDQSIKLLEEGLTLHKKCQEKLTKAKVKVDKFLKKEVDKND